MKKINHRKIKVYGTSSGKLYIKKFDLFNLSKTQNLIKRIANYEKSQIPDRIQVYVHG